MKSFIACTLTAVLASASEMHYRIPSYRGLGSQIPNYGADSIVRTHQEKEELRNSILGAYFDVQDEHRLSTVIHPSGHDETGASKHDGPVEMEKMMVMDEDGEEEQVSVVLPNTHSTVYLDKLKREVPFAFVDFQKPESMIGDATTGVHVVTTHPEEHYYAEPKECHVCHEFADRIA